MGAAMKIYFTFALASLNPIVSFESKVQDHSQGVLFFLVLFCLDGSGKLSSSAQAAISR